MVGTRKSTTRKYKESLAHLDMTQVHVVLSAKAFYGNFYIHKVFDVHCINAFYELSGLDKTVGTNVAFNVDLYASPELDQTLRVLLDGAQMAASKIQIDLHGYRSYDHLILANRILDIISPSNKNGGELHESKTSSRPVDILFPPALHIKTQLNDLDLTHATLMLTGFFKPVICWYANPMLQWALALL
ncbi:hypothetical protein L0F63_003485, partial [Massospora cicadina]